jgi:hypothetical protein
MHEKNSRNGRGEKRKEDVFEEEIEEIEKE